MRDKGRTNYEKGLLCCVLFCFVFKPGFGTPALCSRRTSCIQEASCCMLLLFTYRMELEMKNYFPSLTVCIMQNRGMAFPPVLCAESEATDIIFPLHI